MAKRKFTLPGIHEITKEQEDVRALPKSGQHLVIGGPGTGKSVVALLRAHRHHRNKDHYVFLVYNQLLHHASQHLFGEKLNSCTWDTWFRNTIRTMFGPAALALLAPSGNNTYRGIDWEQIERTIVTATTEVSPDDLPYLIIDEGQDMPPAFYRALTQMGFVNFFVVADQNQNINVGLNSSREDIETVLSIPCEDVIELQANFRNAYPVARLAQSFYTGDPASPPPELPSTQRSVRGPVLVTYGDDRNFSFVRIIDAILKAADRDPSKLLGVITPDNAVRERYFNALLTADVQLDKARPNVQTYYSGSNAQLCFDEGGIMVINAKSCKGLEFDMVFLADIDGYKYWPTIEDANKRLFYVMVARARDRVILLRDGSKPCPVAVILPKDPNVLKRQE